MSLPKPRARTIRRRALLDMIDIAEATPDHTVQASAASLKSWLVFRMDHRTITLPDELEEHYQRVLQAAEDRR